MSFLKYVDMFIENMTAGGGEVLGPNSTQKAHPFSSDEYASGNALNLFGAPDDPDKPNKKKKKRKKFPLYRRNIKNNM
jgi:hypothetical protein